jgi:hypothetical protein
VPKWALVAAIHVRSTARISIRIGFGGVLAQYADFFEGVKEAESTPPAEPNSTTKEKIKRRCWRLN